MWRLQNGLWVFYFERSRPGVFCNLAHSVLLWFGGLSQLIMMEEKHHRQRGVVEGWRGGGVCTQNWNDIIPLKSSPSTPLRCPPLASYDHQLKKQGPTGTTPPPAHPRHTYKNTHTHTQPEALQRLTYEIVGAAGTQHVEGDAGLCVKVQPPLVVLLGEDEVERVTGAPLLRRLHQMLELHPLLSALRCPWLRSLMSISLAVTAMMLKTQKTADRTAASAASTTASPLVHRLHGPGTQITQLVHRAYRVWCSSVLKAPFLSSSPRYEISPSVAYMHTQEDAGKNAMTNSGAGQPSISV